MPPPLPRTGRPSTNARRAAARRFTRWPICWAAIFRLPLNPANGVEAPPRIAWIDESRCIGCARCLAPCPVDAILGAAKFMHTVIEEQCTGCELCVAPCPVDCIEMRDPAAPRPNRPDLNRRRSDAHTARLLRRAVERQRALDAKKAGAAPRTAMDGGATT